MSGKLFEARAKVLTKSACSSQAKAVKLNAKSMDSGVSRIQLWRQQKKKERQEKRRAHYEKNRVKIIENVINARRKSQEDKSGRGRPQRNKNVSVKDATKKRRQERNQQKIAQEKEELREKKKVG